MLEQPGIRALQSNRERQELIFPQISTKYAIGAGLSTSAFPISFNGTVTEFG